MILAAVILAAAATERKPMFDPISQNQAPQISSDGSFYDPAKLQALLAQIQPGADGRKVLGNDAWMQLLNPISGLTKFSDAVPAKMGGGDEPAGTVLAPAQQAVYKDSLGRTYHDDGQGNLTYFNNSGQGWNNPTGSANDYVQPTYKLNADGTGTPVSSGASYSPSLWTSSGRDLAKITGTVLAAGAGGAALGAGEAGAGAAADGALPTFAGNAAGTSLGGGSIAGNAGAAAGALNAGADAGGALAAGAGSAPAYAGVGTAGAGAGTDAIIGANGLAYAPSVDAAGSNGLLGSLGNYLSSDAGLKTLGGLGSAYLQSSAAGNALNAQTNATASANALQKYMYDTTRSDYAPYRAAGTQAVGNLTNLLQNPGSITSDPGYQFGLGQGQTAIDRSAAGNGSLYSGATLKALDRYGQDYAGTKLNDAFTRYANVAQLGATGTAGTAQAGTNYANQSGNNTTGLGNAAAGNALLQGNVWNNALTGAVSAYTNRNKP